MLDSSIKTKHALEKIFSTTSFLVEVYANVDFTFMDERPCLYLLASQRLDETFLYYTLCSIYIQGTRLHITTDATDDMLSDKKLLWRRGVWYV